MNIDVNGDNNRVAGRDYIELRIYCLHCETANHARLPPIRGAITQLATSGIAKAANDDASD